MPTKPPVLNVDTTNAGFVGVNSDGMSSVNMDLDVESSAAFGEGMSFSQDAPSPYSSVGPETPPPPAFEPVSQQVKANSSPEHNRISAPAPMYGTDGNSLAVFPHMTANGMPIAAFQRASPFSHAPSPLSNSPIASSPLSSGSPASYASYDPASTADDASIPVLEISSVPALVQGRAPAPADILMHFDPFDDLDDLPTPLDSTPPSPLSAPTRVRPVLRHASLAQPMSNCPSIGLPPSLFSTYDFLRAENGEAEAETDEEERERKEREREAQEKDERRRAERRERDRERRERQRAAERERLAALAAANGGNAANGAGAGKSIAGSSGSGGVMRREREKARKSSAIGLAPAPAGSQSVPVSPVVRTFNEERRNSEPSTSSSGETPRAERAAAAAANAAQTNGKRGVREKQYKCLKPGCTKSYLNPNGLKYHILKGTCTFAEKPNNASDATPSTGPAAVGPLTPVPSVASAAPPVQLPVPIAVPAFHSENATVGPQSQQMQAFPQAFPAFSVTGVPIVAPSMPFAPAAMTA